MFTRSFSTSVFSFRSFFDLCAVRDHEQNFTIIACVFIHAVSSHMNFKYIKYFRLNTRQQQQQNGRRQAESHDNNELNETKNNNEQAPKGHPIHIESLIFFRWLSEHCLHFIYFVFLVKIRLWSRVSFSLLIWKRKKKLNTASHFITRKYLSLHDIFIGFEMNLNHFFPSCH